MVPFLKWPGGKRWFIYHFGKAIPTGFDRYIEPFLGAGSVYFYMQPKRAILSDTNKELITTYQAIRDDWRAVVAVLSRHQREHGDEHYYRVRDSRPRSAVHQAAHIDLPEPNLFQWDLPREPRGKVQRSEGRTIIGNLSHR